MAKIIGLPRLSPTMEEGTLTRWAKQEGEPVEVDEILAEVETDKAVMEFRSFDQGVLLKILAEEGQTLVPDYPVAIIGKKGEDVTKLIDEAKSMAASAAPSENASVRKESGREPEEPAGPAETPEPSGDAEAAEPSDDAEAAEPSGPTDGRVLASPLVRKLGREHEIDLARVAGTGPGGRIVKRDIEAHLAGAAPSPRPASREPRVERLSSMRKTIARRLTESKQQVPHFYLTVDIDAEPLWQARANMNARLVDQDEKVSINDVVIKAVAMALREEPECNASFAGDAIHYHQRVDISVAVAIPDGLVTPVIRDADQKGVLAISRAVRELAARARDKKLSLEEMTNGTFSVSNLGMFGIEDFSAVINPPEGAILAVGAVRQEPVVQGDRIVPGRRMRMTLSCDHRVIDGAVGARFLATLRGMLESPLTMLL